ncbi:MAG: hypothetical protein JW876_10245 [Candidatus Krumholzibacteriota bacterium]|nr:hypothetical protein [Candidatus Krumholzibacteriota bacterium]
MASATDDARLIRRVYRLLLDAYGPRGWWPVTTPGEREPRYVGGPADERQRFEVAAGALLTQNTAWRNAALAIGRLAGAGALDADRIVSMRESDLAELVRPSGFYNQKAARLRSLARYLAGVRAPTREGLLAIRGIGPETADSIMLYAHGERLFVVDAYTRRIFGRLGLLDGDEGYEDIRRRFEAALPRDVDTYREYHALIVEHAKRHCLRRPRCAGCPLDGPCPANKDRRRQNEKK